MNLYDGFKDTEIKRLEKIDIGEFTWHFTSNGFFFSLRKDGSSFPFIIARSFDALYSKVASLARNLE